MKYRSAIIGYGGMGNWHHKNIREKIDGIEVIGAWDISEKARELAVEHGIKAYSSQEELLGDESIDLVTIAVPNNFHKEISIAALRAGKNVVCEKPVMLSSQDLIDVIAVAKETGKLFSIHQNRRWDKDYLIIKKIYNENTLGKPYFIESRVQGSRRALHGWRGYKVNGGGMVFDWGVHIIDQMMDMIDSKVVSVSAHLFQIFAPEVDDNFKALLRFENGISAEVEVAMNCFILQPRWHMSCSDGTVQVTNWECEGKIVKLLTDAELDWEDEIVYTAAGPTRSMAPRPRHTMQELPLPEVEGSWVNYYKNIVGVLEGTQELVVKPEQALRVLKVIEAIFESDRTGETLKVSI